MTPDEVRECSDCGLLQELPPLEAGSAARCARCAALLRRASRSGTGLPLFCAAVAAVLYLCALASPYMELRAPGRESQATVWDGPQWLYERGVWPLAILVTLVLIAVPGFKLAGLLAVLLGVRRPEVPPWVGHVYRWTRELSPWAMIEIFLLGAFVAYTRLNQLARPVVEPGLWFLGGVMLTSIAADASLDPDRIWDAIPTPRRAPGDRAARVCCRGCGRLERGREGEPCPRCGHALHRRLPGSLQRTSALVLTGLLLYVPANILPVMTVRKLGRGEPNTILSGIIELARAHLWFLAVIVFVASFVVPALKLVSLSTMLVTTHFGARWGLRGRTRLLRLIDVIGRWSMLDVFVLAVLVGLVHLGFTGSVLPGWGAVAFGGVVVITMFAVWTFDSRLMWDAAAGSTEGTTR
jgi:paraquat-inducible protein A